MKANIVDIIEKLKMEVVNEGDKNKVINKYIVDQPSLALAGYCSGIDNSKLQILDDNDILYLRSLPKATQSQNIEALFSNELPCIIVESKSYLPDSILKCAEKYRTYLLVYSAKTEDIRSEISIQIEKYFAEQIQIHATLIDVFGIGVLLTGSSGIGKSETALSLIQRNHVLISDDNVVIKKSRSNFLYGSASDLTKHFLEIRGIGIVNIKTLYGAQAIKEEKRIDIEVQLESWDEKKEYERLGEIHNYRTYLNTDIPVICLPVKSGRNIYSLIELIAVNFKQGDNANDILNEYDRRIRDL